MNIQDFIQDKLNYDLKTKQNKLRALDVIFGQANKNSQKYIKAYEHTSLAELEVQANAIILNKARRSR